MGFILLVVVVLFVVLLFGLFSVAEGRGRMALGGPQGSRRAKRSAGVSAAADMAMRRAGYVGGGDYVSVSDIGLLAYRQSDDPRLVRNGAVWTDTDYLRPYVELWLPYKSRGIVRFELVDSEGRLRYADEAEYDLVQGENALLPGTWLPLRGRAVAPGQWRLRVLVGETLLAAHSFGWQAVGGGEVQRLMAHDGELSPALQQALLGRPRHAMSLSELLSDQEE